MPRTSKGIFYPGDDEPFPPGLFAEGGMFQRVAESVDNALPQVVADIEVTVGTGGDFATVNEALTDLSSNFPTYEQGGVSSTIRLLSGFVMAEQVIARDIYLGWIRLTADDAEVTVNRSALTVPFDVGSTQFPLFGAENATLPVVDCLFSMNTSGTAANRHGFYLFSNGRLWIRAGSGCRNAGGRGLWARQSTYVNAQGAVFANAGSDGITANEGSSINAREADASGAGGHGVWAINGSAIAFREGDATNAAADGIRCDPGGLVHAPSADASGAGNAGLVSQGAGVLHARWAIAVGCGERGAHALNGSNLDIQEGDVRNAGIECVVAANGSMINARDTIATGGGSYGIRALHGSHINAQAATAGGNTDDIRVTNGSIINANGSTGGLSQAANTVTSNGIIFR